MVGLALLFTQQDDVPQDVAVAADPPIPAGPPVGGAAVAHLQHHDALRRVEEER